MHLMIDIETLGNNPSSVVVSAGLVFFTNEAIVASKYWELNMQNQMQLGRTIDEDTIRWWFSQNDEVQQLFRKLSKAEKRKLATVKRFLTEIGEWAMTILNDKKINWGEINVWGNGANFDVVIMEDLYRCINAEIPWKFWNIICFRTFDKLTKCKRLVTLEGTAHNAEDDALYQANCVIAHYDKIKKRKKK